MSTYFNKFDGTSFEEGSPIMVEATAGVIKALSALNAVEEKISTDPDYYVKSLVERLGFKGINDTWFVSWFCHTPKPVFEDLLYKEIAIKLDSKYEGHIAGCKELYVISRLDGSIGKLSDAKIPKGTSVPLFRTVADANFAKDIVSRVGK